jgi:hypothetical protein
MRSTGHLHAGGRSVYRFLVGKPDRKRLLGKPGSRWQNNIKINLK